MRLALPSLLFVPADNDRRLQRAWAAPAGGVIADLEDGVTPSRKATARELLAKQAARGAPKGALLVRINAAGTAEFEEDLDLVTSLDGVDAIVLAKASSEGLLATDFGRPVVALVETAGGILEAPHIAAHPSVCRLMLGTVDLAAELSIEIDPTSSLFNNARAQLVLASAAARKPAPIDGVWPVLRDDNGLCREARIARATGFAAKACIHPDQLDAVHRIFTPSAEELEWARAVVSAAEEGFTAGQGAISVGGEMVDLPVLKRAQRLLAQSRNPGN